MSWRDVASAACFDLFCITSEPRLQESHEGDKKADYGRWAGYGRIAAEAREETLGMREH